MSRTKLSAVLSLLLAACGGNVVVDGSPGASTTGAGGSVTTGAGGPVSTNAGAGGAVIGTAVAATTGAGAGGSTSGGCGGAPTVELAVNGNVFHFGSSCSSSAPPLPVPLGQEFHGGASNDPGTLTIQGCATSAVNSPGIILDASGANAPGTFMIAGFQYVPPSGGGVVGSFPGTLQVDELGPVGGTITGSFQLGQGPTLLQGKFIVCRAPDIDAP